MEEARAAGRADRFYEVAKKDIEAFICNVALGPGDVPWHSLRSAWLRSS